MASVYTETIAAQTTIFTPPADCRTSFTYEGSYYNAISNGILIQNLNQGAFATSCFPRSFSAFGRVQRTQQVYSPGACPGGYTTPVISQNNGITTGICCSSGYTLLQQYSSANFGTTSDFFQGCTSTFRGTTTVQARINNTDLTTSVVTGPLIAWGQAILVQYRSRDLTLFTTTTRSSSLSPSSSTIPSQTSTSRTSSSPTSTGSNQPAASDSGLSTGAKAGIGVGTALGVLLIIGLLAFIIMHRRRNRQQNKQQSMEPYQHTAQMQSVQVSPQKFPAELGPSSAPPNELPTGYSHFKAKSPRPAPVELQG